VWRVYTWGKEIRRWFEHWFMGYISGINRAKQGKDDCSNGVAADGLIQWTENYCRQNPLTPFSSAVDAMLDEIVESNDWPYAPLLQMPAANLCRRAHVSSSEILPGRWGATTPSRHRGGKILTRKPEVKSNGLFPIFASIGCWLSSSIGTFERDLYLISLSLVYRKLAWQ
jgi:hypothetical protein